MCSGDHSPLDDKQLMDRQAWFAVPFALGLYTIAQASILIEIGIFSKIPRSELGEQRTCEDCCENSSVDGEGHEILLCTGICFLLSTMYNLRSRSRPAFPFTREATREEVSPFLRKELFGCRDVITICAGSSALLQYLYKDVPTSYVTDWYGLKTSVFMWVEWVVTVPFMLYVIFAADVKDKLSSREILAISSLFFMVIIAGPLHICTTDTQAMFCLLSSSACYFFAFRIHNQNKSDNLTAILNLSESCATDGSEPESSLILRNKYRIRDMCNIFFTALMYFPAVRILALFGYLNSVHVQNLYAFGSLAVKLTCCQIVSDSSAHLEKEIACVQRDLLFVRREHELEKKQQSVLRLILSNMAHDMKTPLAGFACGLTIIGEDVDTASKALSLLRPKSDSTSSNTSSSIDKTVPVELSSMLRVLNDVQEQTQDLSHLNDFMLISINRCIDFVKASRGVALVPKYDMCNIKEVLDMAYKCMSKVTCTTSQITVLPSAQELSLEIITDKQWFLENVFCLLSNAVKYSHNGHISVSTTLADTVSVFERGSVFRPEFQQGTTIHEQVRDISRSIERSPSCVMVEVIDSGIGLPPDHVKLFGSFQPLQKMAGGTGLGLYSMAKRMEAISGYYGAEHRKDGKQGSVFWFAFPYRPIECDSTGDERGTATNSAAVAVDTEHHECTPPSGAAVLASTIGSSAVCGAPVEPSLDATYNCSAATRSWDMDMSVAKTEAENLSNYFRTVRRNGPTETEAEKSQTVAVADTGRTRLKILLVEDTPTILKMTKQGLKRAGHDVSVAVNGADALTQITEEMTNKCVGTNKPAYDLVLCDICMPVMDGFEFTRRFRLFEKSFHANNNRKDASEHDTNDVEMTAVTDIAETPPSPRTNASDDTAVEPVHQLIVGLSADDSAKPDVLAAGMDDFLCKPFKLASLETILSLNERHHHHHHNQQVEKSINVE